jgi:nucleotide-binding universal stress UspA family protein
VALKDLLVYVDRSERTPLHLRLAADLARRHGSLLTALYVKHWTDTQLEERRKAELGLGSARQIRHLDQRIQQSIDDDAEHVRLESERTAREYRVQTEWCCVEGYPSDIVPQHARYADLCILGQGTGIDDGSADYSFQEHMLFVTGRPVLFVPAKGDFGALGHHIAVAWNSSRPAARAVSDSLPLIERATRTSILTVNPDAYIRKHGAPPAEQLVQHLRRHGATVEVVQIEDTTRSAIADRLQDKAREVGADLLVAGAFGHAQLREKLLGGVTRDLLERTSLPLLMAH